MKKQLKHRFSAAIENDLKTLAQKNNWRALLSITGVVSILAFAIIMSEQSLWFYPISLLLIGSQQRALASVLHESCHRTLCHHRHLNDLIGKWLAGFMIFQSYSSYTQSHVKQHHGFLGDAALDPDYAHYIESGLFDVKDRLDFLLKFVLKTLLLLNVPSYLRYLFKNRLCGLAKEPRELVGMVSVQISIALILTVCAGWGAYIWYWLIPFLTTYQIIGWFSEISEHYPWINRRPGQGALYITRNRFPLWYERIFIGAFGDNYHLVHHLYASIPYWNLRKAHAVMMSDQVYADINGSFGGIFSAQRGKTSVLKNILDELYALHEKDLALMYPWVISNEHIAI